MVTLDIYVDPICPWCLIGKARLERALESRPDHPFQIRWLPFQLNPDMPAGGMARDDYVAMKFGDQAGILRAYQPVIEAAEESGLTLNLPAITRTPNTLDAHRVLHWAGMEGLQTRAIGALMRGYFQQGRDIGCPGTLTEIAASIGMDPTLVARLLDSDADRDLIRETDRDARARGIRGVPFFIVAGTYAVEGAQPASLWQQVVDELAG
ncbi:MAG: DsbA family oxidoreductase [Roseinatronobacter sp.]